MLSVGARSSFSCGRAFRLVDYVYIDYRAYQTVGMVANVLSEHCLSSQPTRGCLYCGRGLGLFTGSFVVDVRTSSTRRLKVK